ncbi:MAG: signal peptidase I [Candidatus Pacearchaeota archaeon]
MNKEVKDILSKGKKFWNFLWHNDSWLSWIVFLIIVFVLIKFIIFPALSFATGSSLPIVIVESCSMYHDGNFENWWEKNREWYEEKGIEKENFEEFNLKNGFNKGDIFFIRGVKEEKLKLGDTIIFVANGTAKPVIHRIIDFNPIQTKGDNNNINGNEQFAFEKNINPNSIIGKATVVRIPYIGWAKLIFFEPFRSQNERGFCK